MDGVSDESQWVALGCFLGTFVSVALFFHLRQVSKKSSEPSIFATVGSDKVSLLMDARCTLGEGIQWDERKGCLMWIDIAGSRLYSLSNKNKLNSWTLPKRPGCFAMREIDSPFLLVGFEDGFALYDPVTRRSQYIANGYRENPFVRLNDGRCDRDGNFIAGGFNEEHAETPAWEPNCHVWRVRSDLSQIDPLFDFTVFCANATCFSPNGKLMYFTDSPRGELLEFDYTSSSGSGGGGSSGGGLPKTREDHLRRVFAKVDQIGPYKPPPSSPSSNPSKASAAGQPLSLPSPPPGSVFDGACVDEDGGLWVAVFNGGRVVHYTKEGILDRQIKVPAPRVTCVCLAGSAYDILCITTARIGLSEEELRQYPHSGGIFAINLGGQGGKDGKGGEGGGCSPGLPESRFRG